MYSFNKIIMVGQAGYNMDKTIASNVDGLDIVVGGHTDTFFYTGTVVLTKSDSDVIFCLRLLSKQLTCTLHLT